MFSFRKLAATAMAVAVVATSFATAKAQGGTIVEVAVKDGRFTTLVAAVTAAGLVDTLNGAGPFTVLAPTDDAFKKVPAPVLAYLLKPENKDLLVKILTYHVVAGKALAKDVVGMKSATSVEGEDITITATDAGVKVNSANVIITDVEASNGVIHVIDSVILPEIKLPEVDLMSTKGAIIASGSSTVYPIAEKLADNFKKDGYADEIKIDSIGTGGGFERFCKNAETDLANASRAIKKEEADACAAKQREPISFWVGIDALAVVVSKQNTFLKNVTKDQLKAIYSGTAKFWSDVDASYPKEEIKLFSPGTDSGTFDYFVEAILGKDKNLLLNAPGVQLSEDDNVLVQGVEGSPYAIGYFGFAYYAPNADKLTALSVNDVTPSFDTAENGKYPLSRPLYVYTTAAILQEKPQVAAFVNYFLTNVDSILGTETGKIGYFPVSSDTLNLDNLLWLASTTK